MTKRSAKRPFTRPFTIEEYLAGVAPERRKIVEELRCFIKEHLPTGYQEGFKWGVISYYVPPALLPKAFSGKGVGYVSLAVQKNCFELFLPAVYLYPERHQALYEAFRAAGKYLKFNRPFIRFRKLDDLALDALAKSIASTSVEELIYLRRDVFSKAIQEQLFKGR